MVGEGQGLITEFRLRSRVVSLACGLLGVVKSQGGGSNCFLLCIVLLLMLGEAEEFGCNLSGHNLHI